MGVTLTVKTGYSNVALGQSFYDAGEVTVVSDDEFDILVDNFGSEDALGTIVTIGGSVADPVYTPVISSRLASLESRVGVSEGDISDLEDEDVLIEDRLDDIEAKDVTQDAELLDHENRITVLEP